MIIKPFNYCFFLLLLIMTLIVIVSTIILKNKTEKTKTIFITCYAIYNIVLFIVYKYMLSLDKDFDFNIYNELPLQLCNINMFIIPLSLLLKKDSLKAFGFYFGTIGAFLAIVSPETAFVNNSIFLFRNIGFYFTHLNIMAMGIMLVTLKTFTPSFKLLPKLVVFIILLSLGIFVIDLGLSALTHTLVNYFFVMDPVEIGLLEMFYDLVPIKYIYMLLPLICVMIIICIITAPFEIVKFLKSKRELALTN